MNRQEILMLVEEILKSKGIESKVVELGQSTVIGINNVPCFEVMDNGFVSRVDPNEIRSLETRPEANIITNDLVPDNTRLFININSGSERDLIDFWVAKTIEHI